MLVESHSSITTMDSKDKIVVRYAQALFNLSRERKRLEEVFKDLKIVDTLMEQSREFAQFIINPVIPLEKQQSIVQALFQNRLDQVTYVFISFLVNQRRLALLSSFYPAFETLYFRHKMIKKITIVSSFPLAERQAAVICQQVKAIFNAEIFPEIVVDPALLGGFKIKIDDLVYDLTIRTQMSRIKDHILWGGRSETHSE